ncbi:hypothetical protein Pmani_021241 [Petrolisthes manimaculis]|uniref:Uncharacterized protein n=1 Tax=Petrolisthes manimaculis TaxID=1843537 RepID=A0AAE1U5N2_9EUCA|nr:hypothetical protein Pmani_021241 [Petrolisthes manimaculis]
MEREVVGKSGGGEEEMEREVVVERKWRERWRWARGNEERGGGGEEMEREVVGKSGGGEEEMKREVVGKSGGGGEEM